MGCSVRIKMCMFSGEFEVPFIENTMGCSMRIKMCMCMFYFNHNAFKQFYVIELTCLMLLFQNL